MNTLRNIKENEFDVKIMESSVDQSINLQCEEIDYYSTVSSNDIVSTPRDWDLDVSETVFNSSNCDEPLDNFVLSYRKALSNKACSEWTNL